MNGIYPELDARLSAELDRYYFSTDGSGLRFLCLLNLMRISNMKSGKGFSVADICLWLWRVFFPRW